MFNKLVKIFYFYLLECILLLMQHLFYSIYLFNLLLEVTQYLLMNLINFNLTNYKMKFLIYYFCFFELYYVVFQPQNLQDLLILFFKLKDNLLYYLTFLNFYLMILNVDENEYFLKCVYWELIISSMVKLYLFKEVYLTITHLLLLITYELWLVYIQIDTLISITNYV